jgi:transcription elongation factor GreB
MSKAFVREDNNSSDDQELPDENAPVPAGTKNYMTPAGAKRLQDELKNLIHTARPEVVRVVA